MKNSIYLKLWLTYGPEHKAIGAAAISLALTIGAKLATPWPMGILVDDVLTQKGPVYIISFSSHQFTLWQATGLCALVFFTLHCLYQTLNGWVTLRVTNIGLRILFSTRNYLYRYLQYLPISYHHTRRTGDSVYRVAYDAQSVQRFFIEGFNSLIPACMILCGTIAVMFWIDSVLAFSVFLMIPFLFFAIRIFAKKIRSQTSDLQRQESKILSEATEGLGSTILAQAFGREDYHVERFNKESMHSVNANQKLCFTQVISNISVGLIIALGTAVIIVLGSYRVAYGHLQLGEFLVFISYVAMLYQPLEVLGYTAWTMEGAAAGAQRVFEVLETNNTLPDAKGAADLCIKDAAIAWRDVYFSHDNRAPLLTGLSLEVRGGETIAIMGDSGAGKTSLLALLLRFYEPQGGVIEIDNQNISSITKASLRRGISAVLQETVILNGTIYENIQYGRPGASLAEVAAAAKAANIDTFISSLSAGYNTQVGENGVNLSGGERQRIAIARAYLRDAPILLMDEPTSALDISTEQSVMSSINNLMKKKTTILVTHRLQVAETADRVFTLKEGTLTEGR